MVQNDFSDGQIPAGLPQRKLIDFDPPGVTFPIQRVQINWDRLTAKRPLLLETLDTMPAYLLKPEVLTLLAAEKNPGYRLILDIMWSTGARVSEALALTPASFKADRFDFGVILKTLKQRSGR